MKIQIKSLLLENIKINATFTGNKLISLFNVKDKTKFDRKYDLFYIGGCSKPMCNNNYIDDAKRRISERVKDHNRRDSKSNFGEKYYRKEQ